MASALRRLASAQRFGVVHERVAREGDGHAYDQEEEEAELRGPARSRSEQPRADERRGAPGLRKRSTSLGDGLADVVVEGWRVSRFLTVNTARLLRFTGLSFKAWFMFLRLMAFACLLLPNFLIFVWRYLSSPLISRRFYGPERRQSLDVYTSRPAAEMAGARQPVIVFFSGGAWTIGYKAWGAVMGFCYSQLGFVFIAPDYRNAPQTTIDGMLQDVDLAVGYVLRHAQSFGGDPERVVLMGQSAGAHLACMALLGAVRRENLGSSPRAACDAASAPHWSLGSIRGFVGISGPFNLELMHPHLARRGLPTALLDYLFHNDLARYSPVHLVRAMALQSRSGKIACAPKIVLVHGTADLTVPHTQSVELHQVLREALADPDNTLALELLPGNSHTDPIIEAPFRGVDPLLLRCIFHLDAMVAPRQEQQQQHEATAAREAAIRALLRRTLLPDVVIDAAQFVNPF